jgi:carbon monoxide dehydrogenase subunit G
MAKATTFKRAIDVNVTPAKAWEILADFGLICHGHPAVDTSRVTSKQREGVGATRHCDFNIMGATAEERVVEWNPGRNVKIEVYELKNMPGIATTTMDLALEPKGNGTRLTATMTYTMKNAFFDVMNSVMMRGMNSKLLDGIVAGHKKYMETGQIVTKKTVLELDKVVKVQ